MNSDFTAKVLLTLYKQLPTAICGNEKTVMKTARAGFYTRGYDETLKLCEKMLSLNEEKIVLINLKLLMDKAFNLMLSEDMRIIIMRFFKGMKFIDMADALDVSLRQTFRVYDRAVTSFATQLEYLKYPADVIEREFGNLTVFQGTKIKLSDAFGLSSD